MERGRSVGRARGSEKVYDILGALFHHPLESAGPFHAVGRKVAARALAGLGIRTGDKNVKQKADYVTEG